MELHPLVFALLAYGIAVVIAVLVALIVKFISFTVQRKQAAAADEGAEAESAKGKGGNR